MNFKHIKIYRLDLIYSKFFKLLVLIKYLNFDYDKFYLYLILIALVWLNNVLINNKLMLSYKFDKYLNIYKF